MGPHVGYSPSYRTPDQSGAFSPAGPQITLPWGLTLGVPGNNEGVTLKRALITVAALLQVSASAPAGANLLQPWDLRSVQDSQNRFVISVPATWRVEQSDKNPALSAKSLEPQGTSPDSVEVFVRDMPFPLSPEGCLRQVAWVMRMTIHQWTTLSEGPDTVGGIPAYSRAYLWHLPGGEERRSLQTCVSRDRRVFVIIGTTMNTPTRVAESLPGITRVIGTFRLGPAALPAAPEPRSPASDR